MQVLLDGFQVFRLYWLDIFIFLVSALGWGTWLAGYLSFSRIEPLEARLPLALGLGCLALLVPALGLVLLVRVSFWLARIGSYLLALSGCVLLVVRRGDFRGLRPGRLLVSLALLFGLLLVRLAFGKDLLLPPYDDGPEHYAILQSFLDPSSRAAAFYSLETLTRHYYHFGFHVLAAWLNLFSAKNMAGSMVVLGQLFLLVYPLSVFGLAWRVTRRLEAAALAGALTAFAWSMPAYAANWAKYPAMAGLALLPVVIGLWLGVASDPGRGKRELGLSVVLTLALVLIHTRTAICLLLVAAGVLFARFYPIKRNLRFWGAVLLTLLTLGVILAFGDTLWLYFGNGYRLPLLLIALLMPFSWYRHPKMSLAVLTALLGAWLASRLPTPVASFGPAWLDQPFLAILLPLPLSLFAAGGLAGLLELVNRPIFHWAALVICLAPVCLGFLTAGTLYPDSCCDYVKPGDLQAMQWIEQNTPDDSVFWIPAFRSHNYLVGMDAGVWIHALTGRNANKLRYDFSWNKSGALSSLCRSGGVNVYIYEGGRSYSFDDVLLSEQDWVRPVFSMGSVKIYQVAGTCSP